MLDRLRRCNNAKPTLFQRLLSAGEKPHLTRYSYTAQQNKNAVSGYMKKILSSDSMVDEHDEYTIIK